MIQIIGIIVPFTKIVISYFGHGNYGTYFPYQILTITKFVAGLSNIFLSPKFVACMKKRQLNTMPYCPWIDVQK
jgi:hypothetical protein